jgi:hypothetical protein
MSTFDAPNRDVCVVRRNRTNTPLQALVTLNDEVYIEAAQALARRVLREAEPNDEKRVAYAFRLCVGRAPTPPELNRLLTLVNNERQNFSKDTEAASLLGKAKKSGQEDVAQLAAWTVVGNVLLNLDETVTKN